MIRTLPRAFAVLAALGVVAAGLSLGFAQPASPAAPDAVTVVTAAPGPSTLEGRWPAKPKPKAPTSFLVADAIGPRVSLFAAPDVPLADKPTVSNPTWEGLPLVFSVLEDRGPWLHVRVSRRPNDFTAWVQRSQVTLRTVPNHVLVEIGKHQVTVFHGDEVLFRAPVATGRPNTPTPTGNFFVDGIVPIRYSGGPYGPFQVSISGFSNVLRSFGGGIGQIAMHGTNHPELMGQNVSNGCIRMQNESIKKIAMLAPTGTPVTVIP